jgi:hypothetical protein
MDSRLIWHLKRRIIQRFFSIETFQKYFVCVGVMYSGEYDVCDVTLSVHPHRASWKVSFPTVAKLTFQLARCGLKKNYFWKLFVMLLECALRVTSQTTFFLKSLVNFCFVLIVRLRGIVHIVPTGPANIPHATVGSLLNLMFLWPPILTVLLRSFIMSDTEPAPQYSITI